VVFVVHGQVIEALSLWARKVDRADLSQRLSLRYRQDDEESDTSVSKHIDPATFHPR
jgi:hypothetical protein